MYDLAGSISGTEARELRVQAQRLLAEVIDWILTERPALLP
jgi:hypothetical protein